MEELQNPLEQGSYNKILSLRCWVSSVNTFSSPHLVFEDKKEPILFENASNLTHEFLFVVMQKLIRQI